MSNWREYDLVSSHISGPKRRERTFVYRGNPNSSMGSAVSQFEAPLSEASVVALFC